MISVTLIHKVGTDLDVVNAARVSFNKTSTSMTNSDKRLIKYLATHEHHSPFNHCFLTFHVKAPIFVARQLVKHKFMPWNEVSRRYVKDMPEFYTPTAWRAKPDADRKQGSGGTLDKSKSNIYDTHYKYSVNASMDRYNYLIKQGVAPEQARMVLPQSTLTEWWWSGTLGAILDMLRLRLKDDTQEETRQVATLIASEVKRIFPCSYNAVIGEAEG